MLGYESGQFSNYLKLISLPSRTLETKLPSQDVVYLPWGFGVPGTGLGRLHLEVQKKPCHQSAFREMVWGWAGDRGSREGPERKAVLLIKPPGVGG